MLCHPQQIASTKTNLLLYDKRTCLGRNKLNLGVVIWVWCLHMWPMQHRPAEVRVSNYNTGVLRRAQRDAKANGVFVQPTAPWREWVLLGTLCATTEAVRENLGGSPGSRVVLSMFLPCEGGLVPCGGLEEKQFPANSTCTAPLGLCGKGWAGAALQGQPGSSARLSLQPKNRPAMSIRQSLGTGCWVRLDAALGLLPEPLGRDGQPGGCRAN